MADLDQELGGRLARLAESVPVAPWLGHVEPSPVAARQRLRMAWLTPLVALVIVGAAVAGPDMLWNAGLLWPNDGPIELWTTRQSAGTVCPAARGGGWLIRHPRSGLGVADASGERRSAIKWPAGYSARIEQGRAMLLGPGGTVVAREGDRVAFGGAGISEPDGTESFWACFGVEVVTDVVAPTDGPVATDGPAPTEPGEAAVVGTDTHGPYSLELRSEKAVYHASDLIQVTGTFTYSGQVTNAVQGFKSGFGILEPVYGISMQPAYTMECNHTTFEPGHRIVGPFQKSGGVSGSDPEHDFKLAYLQDPEFRLPPGTWHLQYSAFWNEGECGSETMRVSTQIEIVVLPDDPAPSAAPGWTQIDLMTSQPGAATVGYCRMALSGGRLVPDPESGIGVAGEDRPSEPIMWPFGYTGWRDGQDLVLVDSHGQEIARTGDLVQFGGGIENDPVFRVCGGIEIVVD